MRLAAIPSVDRILQDPRLAPAIARLGRPLVVGELRALLAEYRSAMKAGAALPPTDDAIALGLLNRLEAVAQPGGRRPPELLLDERVVAAAPADPLRRIEVVAPLQARDHHFYVLLPGPGQQEL